MPELPEVTTIVNDLNKMVAGKTIRDFYCEAPRIIRPLTAEEFRKKAIGKKFISFERKGKYIVANVEEAKAKTVRSSEPNFRYLVFHMRMTGHLLYRDEKKETTKQKEYFADPRNQFTRMVFYFTDGTRLDFSDMRKFGTVHFFRPDELAQCSGLRTLGPDALRYRWSAEELEERLSKKKISIKQALLDQTVVAGIGNIYADEILWTAKINPLITACSLKKEEREKIIKAMGLVLKRAVKARGTSVDDYRDASGRKGKYGLIRRVYRRANEPCFDCGKKIVKIKLGGRGTHFCPYCQKQTPRKDAMVMMKK